MYTESQNITAEQVRNEVETAANPTETTVLGETLSMVVSGIILLALALFTQSAFMAIGGAALLGLTAAIQPSSRKYFASINHKIEL